MFRSGWRIAALAGAVAACICGNAAAATITVDTTNDEVVSNTHCSLREALDASLFHTAFDGCAAGDGNDTIALGPGHYTLTIPGADEDNNGTGDLDVRSNVTIQGAGASSTTIDAGHLDRAFDIANGVSATVSQVTVTGGKTPAGADETTLHGSPDAISSSFGNNGEEGGGIRNAGTLTISDSVITGNTTGKGGHGQTAIGANATTAGNSGGNAQAGPGGQGGWGGGIWSSGDLTIQRSSVIDNTTGPGGAGGNAVGGTGADGSGTGNGGAGGSAEAGNGGSSGEAAGISASGALTIRDSTIGGNTAGDGGSGGIGLSGNGGAGGSGGGSGGSSSFGEGGPGGIVGVGGLSVGGPTDIRDSAITGNGGGTPGSGGAGSGGSGGEATAAPGNGGKGGRGTGGPGGEAFMGGIFINTGGAVMLVNATIDGNRGSDGAQGGAGFGGHGGQADFGHGGDGGEADAGGGGTGGDGGVFANPGPTVALTHVTLSGNAAGAGGPSNSAATAGQAGTGLLNGSGGTTHAGPAGNAGIAGISSVASLTLTNTILASNAGLTCSGSIADGGHDISFGDVSCPGLHVDPELGPLQDNGGPTLTRAIASGSPARDAVPASGASCPSTDQRGIPRPQGPACDIGAFELVPAAVGGGGGGASNGPAPDTAAPVFRSASLSPSVFAVDPKGTSETAVAARAKKKPKRGTTFHYSVSESSRVVFTIERPVPGRKVGRSCRKQTKSNRKKKRCTLYVLVGRFAQQTGAGQNSKRFSGKIGGHALKPGSYRATLVATDAAHNVSVPKRLSFKVVRG